MECFSYLCIYSKSVSFTKLSVHYVDLLKYLIWMKQITLILALKDYVPTLHQNKFYVYENNYRVRTKKFHVNNRCIISRNFSYAIIYK